MTLIQQLLLGSLYLGICLVVEAGLLVLCIHVLRKRLGVLQRGRHFVQISAILAVAIGLIVFAHTLQVWIWATALIFSGAIGDWNTAIYFSLATYTTLGYGDIVLGDADGVTIVPLERAEEILTAAQAILKKEAKLMEALKKGATLAGYFGPVDVKKL
mgnify:CR=1 FL=1